MGAHSAHVPAAPDRTAAAPVRVAARAPASPQARILGLQRSHGNAAVARTLARCSCASCQAGGPCESEPELDEHR